MRFNGFAGHVHIQPQTRSSQALLPEKSVGLALNFGGCF